MKPVATPNRMRPGASLLSEASALAATGAMRFDGISIPVPSLIFFVASAAAVMATNRSALMSWLSTNHAASNPSSSARFTIFHESADGARLMPNSILAPARFRRGHAARITKLF